MSHSSARHSTIVLARTYAAPVARVFAAVADPAERERVHAETERLTVVFDEVDLRVGGRDRFRFGRGGTLRFRGESIYHDVVPERRIVCTDIVSDGEVRLSIAATTLEFASLGQRTQLKVTAQVVWLDGGDAIEGADARYAALLDNLERYFGGNLRPRARPVRPR